MSRSWSDTSLTAKNWILIHIFITLIATLFRKRKTNCWKILTNRQQDNHTYLSKPCSFVILFLNRVYWRSKKFYSLNLFWLLGPSNFFIRPQIWNLYLFKPQLPHFLVQVLLAWFVFFFCFFFWKLENPHFCLLFFSQWNYHCRWYLELGYFQLVH